MKDWKKILVLRNKSVLSTMKVIEENASQFAIVVDSQGHAIGTVTDGDIRRGILAGVKLDEHIDQVIHKEFFWVEEEVSDEEILESMDKKGIVQIPVLNADKKVIDVKSHVDLLKVKKRPNPVILMVGGLGSRLGNVTKDCPKPMLKVGNVPILESIIRNFAKQGLVNIFLAVNYKYEIIENYFKNGEDFGVTIQYIKEDQKLGTVGALSLIDTSNLTGPAIVMNGDLLTKINFSKLLDYHTQNSHSATMCIRQYEYQVPYGVVSCQGTNIINLEEKPTRTHFINAGIYSLSLEVFKNIPYNTKMDMTELFNSLLGSKNTIGAFPLNEYWVDIGKADDLQRARNDASDDNSK